MNYIKEAENYLRHYRDLKYSINHLNTKINKLSWEGCPSSLNSIQLDGMPHGNKVKDDMYNIAFEIKMCQKMKNDTETEIMEIDKILKKVGDEDRSYEQVLRLWYIDKKSKEEIANEINYSSRTTIYEIKNKAIRKFAVMLFGIDAVAAS